MKNIYKDKTGNRLNLQKGKLANEKIQNKTA